MKNLIGVLTIVMLATRLLAQSNAPVRLALISESAEAAVAADVLTAQLSGNNKVQLLERNEIEKIYREQGLSAANRDYLKLGHVLGADGLLLLDIVRTPQSTKLITRLIAVKPGVVLLNEGFSWPLEDTTGWAPVFMNHLNPFLPKLSVLPKDAIPISVVNLRSAVQSAEGQETERQMKRLVIQRLSQERQFFVLERQQMQRLGEEKEMKADESAFWNGSYLLEGVIDQNGYSKDLVTINARLTRPQGGALLLMEVSGNRTNFAEVINQLALKTTGILKVSSAAKEWNADDEAQQYYDEAKWALQWKVFSEAQAAADSAWALGKRDLACALVRVQAYVSEVSADVARYESSETTYTPGGYDANGAPNGPPPGEAKIQSDIMDMSGQHIWGMAYKETKYESTSAITVRYAYAVKSPDSKNIDRAIHALELYSSFSRSSPEGVPKVLWRGMGDTDWHDSDWYQLGLDNLIAASQVLQNFNFTPELQKPVADKLMELRALARSVAEVISRSLSVQNGYFVGDRVTTHDELSHTIEENPNIFRVEVNWGCFWQERPEDSIALYRGLMSSPVFCYIHKDFWLRNLQAPRLVAWSESDRQRVPTVWNNFLGELEVSTNVLLQLEGKALAFADADDEKKLGVSFTNLFNAIFENRDALVANPVEVLYLDWGVGDLVSAKTRNGIVTATKESLNDLYWHGYRSKLEAMDQDYWNNTDPDGMTALVYKIQKQYLASFAPYSLRSFGEVFSTRDYTKAQALELQPLIAAYKSNLVAQASASEKFKAQADAHWIEFFLEREVNEILHPTAPQPRSQASIQALEPATMVKAAIVVKAPTTTAEIETNVIAVGKFLPIPAERLLALDPSERISFLRVTITAHHWCEGKLLLDYDYYARTRWLDGKGKVMGGRNVDGRAIAIFDPATEHWDVVGCREAGAENTMEYLQSENYFYHRSTLLHGELFSCEGRQIKKYNFQSQEWEVLAVSDGNNYELFAIHGHLYAANPDMIFEILDGGKAIRILASTRRNPPVSALDRENLGRPTLFEGPNDSLRVCAAGKIFTWTDNDWQLVSTAPPASFQPEIIPDGLLFRELSSVSYLATETNVPELCLWQKISAQKPLWKIPSDLFLAHLPVAAGPSGLYLLMNHSEIQDIANKQGELAQAKVVAKDGYNAALLCYSRGLPLPQKLFLNFDAPDGCPPSAGINPNSTGGFPALPPAWMLATTNILFLGLETPRRSMPAFNQADRIGVGYKAGIWLLPVSQIDAEITAQKQIQLEKKAAAGAAAEQAWKALLSKYDKNHNGIIDRDEKEEALESPDYIETELDTIDANHNGRLEAEELAWFDANQNKMLESKEQAGIDVAQHLVVEKLLKEMDVNGDGFLDRSEFVAFPDGIQGPMGLAFPDRNQDGRIDAVELESFLKQQTRKELRLRGGPTATVFNQSQNNAGQPFDPGQLFKAEVEFYWQHPGATNYGQTFDRGIPPGWRGGTNGMPPANNQTNR